MSLLDLPDHARSAAISFVARTPLLPLVAKRDTRALTRAALAIAVALLVTIARPALALAVSPAIFGVPHIAASFRYLVLRGGVTRSFCVASGVLALVMLGLRVLEQYGDAPSRYAFAEVSLAILWALTAAFAAARSARRPLRFMVAAAGIALGGSIALAHPSLARIAFVHVHNLGAPVLWLVFFRRGSFPVRTVALLAAVVVLLLSGVTASWTIAAGGESAIGVDLVAVGRWLVPGAAAAVALPLVLVHVFTDSVHYAFWLGVIPDETLTHEGSLSFRMTGRALVRDFGVLGVAAIIALTLVVLGASFVDTTGARNAYFAVAGFHGYVEGAMLIYAWVSARRGL